MVTEYRLVTERPAHQAGLKQKVYSKRSYDHARSSLADWYRDQERYLKAGYHEPWHAWIEQREVTAWERIDLTPGEAVPI